MIKLLRDSLFKPKNIIHYRAKKGWFVFLYVLLVSFIYSFSIFTPAIRYDGLDYSDKLSLEEYFELASSSIVDGTYVSSEDILITISNKNIYFSCSEESSKEVLKKYYIDIMFLNDKVYLCYPNVSGSNAQEICSLSDLFANEFLNYELNSIDTNSDIFNEIDRVLMLYKPLYISLKAVAGIFSGAFTMLLYALFSYIFLNITLNAKDYMKKEQLFKMMIFSSTGIVFAEMIVNLFNISGIFSFIILLVGFFPFYALEREFINRIRIQKFGSSVMDDPNVINKINELLNKDENEDDNDKGE